MVSQQVLANVTRWARPPVTTAFMDTAVAAPAEVAAVLEKAQPMKAATARGAQKYEKVQVLSAEPERVRAGVARYIPRKTLGSIIGALLVDASPRVCAEVLARQAADDGHLTATRAVLAHMHGNVTLYREVAFLLGEPSEWLLDAPNQDILGRSGQLTAVHLLSAFRPPTIAEQQKLVRSWGRNLTGDNLNGSYLAFANQALELGTRDPYHASRESVLARNLDYVVVSELFHGHEKVVLKRIPSVMLSYEDAYYVFNGAPNFRNARHSTLVTALDIALQRDVNLWVEFSEKYETSGAAAALQSVNVPCDIHPLGCYACIAHSHIL